MKAPIISVVLGCYNRLSYLKLTIESVRKELENISHEIIIVDGGSDDGTLLWLVEQKDIITIVQHNRGTWAGKPITRRSWGYFMNLGFKSAQGKYICMLSDDCLIVPGAIVNGYNVFEQELARDRKIGAVAFYWRNWSQQENYYVGHTLGNKLYVNHGMYLNTALKAVDYIDEETFFFYNGDGDLCLKLWHAGYECIESPDSYIEHYPHANVDVRKTNYQKFNQDLELYLKKWEGIFYDPKLNNLGMYREKAYHDPLKTGELFMTLHVQVLEKYPNINKKSWIGHAAKTCSWVWKAVKRKVRVFLSS